MKKMLLLGLVLSFLSWYALLNTAEENLMADLVLFNGKVFTVEKAIPWAEAVAVRDGKIIAVGADVEVKKLIGSSTQAIDLQGKLVLPRVERCPPPFRQRRTLSAGHRPAPGP